MVEGHAERFDASPLVALGGRVVHLEEPNAGGPEPQRPPVVAGADDHDLRDARGDGVEDLGVEEARPGLHPQAAVRRAGPEDWRAQRAVEATLRAGVTVGGLGALQLRARQRDAAGRHRGPRVSHRTPRPAGPPTLAARPLRLDGRIAAEPTVPDGAPHTVLPPCAGPPRRRRAGPFPQVPHVSRASRVGVLFTRLALIGSGAAGTILSRESPACPRVAAEPMTTIELNPPRWVEDPAGRFAQRYWDGDRWTDFVAGHDGGAADRDPWGAAPHPAPRSVDALPTPPVPGPEPVAPDTDATVLAARDDPGSPGALAGATAGVAAWKLDPSGRHAQRYWDGERWTQFVAEEDGGPATISPLDDVDGFPAVNGEGSPAGPSPDAGTATAAAAGATAGVAAWRLDPSGRHAQRYWDGERWTQFVAEEDGGPATPDPVPVEPAVDPIAWSANGSTPTTAAPTSPEGEAATAATALGFLAVGGAAAAAVGTAPSDLAPPAPRVAEPVTRPEAATASAETARRWPRALLVAAVVLALLAATVGALDLAGVFGGSSSPVAHRASLRKPGAASASGKAAGTSVGGTAVTTPTGAVFAAKNPCGLLTSAQIATVTAIPVGSAQPILGGCAWRGPGPIGGSVSALDRQAFGAQEGVLLTATPNAGLHPSVSCTASIPFVPVASGICSGSGSQEGEYAMFLAAGNTVVQISIHTARPETPAQLAQLAQLAYQHTT